MRSNTTDGESVLGVASFAPAALPLLKMVIKSTATITPPRAKPAKNTLDFVRILPSFAFSAPHAFFHLIHPLFLSNYLLFKILPKVMPHVQIVVFSMSLDGDSCLQSETIHIPGTCCSIIGIKRAGQPFIAD